jgi:hypothetical protein
MIEDLPVGKTKDGAADGAEPAITGDIASGAREVRCPISFDHESGLAAEEVEDKGPERMLSSELGAAQRSAAQQLPQSALGGGSRSPQGASPVGLLAKQARHACSSTQASLRLRPSIAPLPPGEGLG